MTSRARKPPKQGIQVERWHIVTLDCWLYVSDYQRIPSTIRVPSFEAGRELVSLLDKWEKKWKR